MERVAQVLKDARVAGLQVLAEDDRLIVRGPKRWQELAETVLRHKPEILMLLAKERDEIAWRAEAMRCQVRPGRPIPFLVARACEAIPEHCLSCGEGLPSGHRVRCHWCVGAAQQVLGWECAGNIP